ANAANAEEAASASEETSGQAESLRELVNELTQLVNGGSSGGSSMRPAGSYTASPTKLTARLSHMVKQKTGRSPEQVIPFDESDMSDF
ncbi:hypothetical protein KKH18_08415, partial [bacterium]|nr:hypothetical protein [bacterium]